MAAMPYRIRTHRARRPPDTRPSACKRLYGRAWDKARRAHLRDNPLCVDCLAKGKRVPAFAVDHEIPHRGDPVLFWDRNNWRSRCEHHHNLKTATTDRARPPAKPAPGPHPPDFSTAAPPADRLRNRTRAPAKLEILRGEPKRKKRPPLRLEWIDPADLTTNPKNWRTHPETQVKALREVIDEVGWAGALLFNEATGRLIDGHARKELFAGKSKVPVLVGSWTEAQEKKILATLDPLATLAQKNADKLDALLAELAPSTAAIDELLRELGSKAPAPLPSGTTPLQPVDTLPPPRMSWVLIGIPTVRFGEIAGQVEELAAVEGIVCETTVNNG
jgi:5-methylcytosine-specific restriction protein A